MTGKPSHICCGEGLLARVHKADEIQIGVDNSGRRGPGTERKLDGRAFIIGAHPQPKGSEDKKAEEDKKTAKDKT